MKIRAKVLVALALASMMTMGAAAGSYSSFRTQISSLGNTVKSANFAFTSDQLTHDGTTALSEAVSFTPGANDLETIAIHNYSGSIVSDKATNYTFQLQNVTTDPDYTYTLYLVDPKTSQLTKQQDLVVDSATGSSNESQTFYIGGGSRQTQTFELQISRADQQQDLGNVIEGKTQSFDIVAKATSVVDPSNVYVTGTLGGQTIASGEYSVSMVEYKTYRAFYIRGLVGGNAVYFQAPIGNASDTNASVNVYNSSTVGNLTIQNTSDAAQHTGTVYITDNGAGTNLYVTYGGTN